MSLEIIFGCMFSGKSSELRSRLTRYADVDLKVLYINHSKDKRVTVSFDEYMSTHDSGFQKMSSKVTKIKAPSLDDIDVVSFQIIGIDEAQFFNNIDSVIRKWVLTLRKRVIIASLDLDFKLRPFGEVHNLVGLCAPGGLKKLSAICKMCDPNDLRDAGYTLKISEDDSLLDPGGSDKYLPVCLPCYQKYNKHF